MTASTKKEVKAKRMTLCTTTGQVFKSTAEAARVLSLNQCTVSACCLGNVLITGGFQFKYIFVEDDGIKICKSCNEKFSGNGCSSCKREYWKRYYINNNEKVKASKKLYKENNKEKIRLQSIEYQKNNALKISMQQSDWYLRNKEYANKRNSDWQKNNREKCAIYRHNRDARVRGRGRLSKGLSEKLFDLQKGKCPCCRLPLGDDFELDHIMPIKLGGKNEDSNIQLLRKSCNRQKSAKHPVDFMRSRGFLF